MSVRVGEIAGFVAPVSVFDGSYQFGSGSQAIVKLNLFVVYIEVQFASRNAVPCFRMWCFMI